MARRRVTFNVIWLGNFLVYSIDIMTPCCSRNLVVFLAFAVNIGCENQPTQSRDPLTRDTRQTSGSTQTLEEQVASHDLSDVDATIKQYSALINTAPSADAYRNRGDMWTLKKEFPKALSDYDEAIRLNSDYAPAWHNRGRVWRELGEYEKAVSDYSQALRVNDEYAIAYANRGILLMWMGEFEDAATDLTQAIELDPRNVQALNALARIHCIAPIKELRDGNKALDLAQKACNLTNWTSIEHLETLAAAYAETEQFDDAVQWQTKALSLAGDRSDDEMRGRLETFKAGNKLEFNEDVK